MKKYFKKYKFIRKINDKSIFKFRESISKYDWDYIYSNNDINLIFNYFIDNLYNYKYNYITFIVL